MSLDIHQKSKESSYMEMSRDVDHKHAYISTERQLQNPSLTFIHKNKSLFSATSILSCSPMAYNTTASLDKLSCTDYVDFDKCQDRFGRFSWPKNDSNYLEVKLKVFKKDDNKEFRLVQNLTMGEADFNQFMRLKNQLVNAAEKFAREENLTPVQIPTMSEDMDEQLKRAHKVVDVVDRANRKICVTLLRYNLDKLKSSYAQFRLFARKKEDEFQQVVYVNYKLEELNYLLDVKNSVYDKIFTNQPICNVLQNKFHRFTLYQYFSNRVKLSWNFGDNRKLFFKLKWKLGLCHVVLTTPRTSPGKPTLTVVEMQQLPDIEKTDSKEELSCLEWTIYSGRRKVCVNFQTDTDKLNIAVYCNRNYLLLKDNEVDLNLTEYQSLLAKQVYLLSYIDIFYKRFIVLDETTVHK